MRLINNLIIVNLNNKDYNTLLINGINGAIVAIDSEERCIINSWVNEAEIRPQTPKELSMYHILISKQFLLEGVEEEAKIKSSIIAQLKRKCINLDAESNIACFILSYNCNFRCPYCYEAQIAHHNILSEDMVDRIFAINSQIEYISLFGGEPLLPSHKKIIEYIISKAPNAYYSVITNGYYLHEYLPILSKLNIKNIQVTLDGTEEYHNRTRITKNGSPTYSKIISGIKECVQLNLPITIRMNISLENIDNCYQAINDIKSQPWGHSIDFEMQPLFQYGAEQKEQLYKSLLSKDAKPKENQIFQRMLPISNYLMNGGKLLPIIRTCDAEQKNRFYDPDGYIYNCILAVGHKEKAIGTFYPDFTLKKDSFITRDITTIAQCKTCKYSLFCGGGCPNGLPCDSNLYTPNCAGMAAELEYLIPAVMKCRESFEE